MGNKRRGNTTYAERPILKGELNSAKNTLTYIEGLLDWSLKYGDDNARRSVIITSIRAIRSAREAIKIAREYISNT